MYIGTPNSHIVIPHQREHCKTGLTTAVFLLILVVEGHVTLSTERPSWVS